MHSCRSFALLSPSASQGARQRCRLAAGAASLGLFIAVAAAPVDGCYAVVVGRNASTDGSILVGHSEQSGTDQHPNLRVIPPLNHPPGSEVLLRAGGHLPEAPETYGFIWSELPGQEFSDAYMNQWGVAVVSDVCATREDRLDLTDGGIGYQLRRLVAQRARTAREGVHLAGQLVEKFGYTATGRTLVIAGPQEAWLVSLVQGRHWVARRVPDDGVVLLPNVHIITRVDLADTLNFLGSADVIDYAVERGWYEPDSGRPFSFRAAYNHRERIDPRQWRGQQLVLNVVDPPLVDGQLPFAVHPGQPLGVADVMAILRDRQGERPLCIEGTQEGAVFQLRDHLPPAIGCVYWRAATEPCTGLLVPWYAGITQTPEDQFHAVPLPEVLTTARHFSSSAEVAGASWATFKGLQDAVNAGPPAAIDSMRAAQSQFEGALLKAQPGIEARAVALYAEDPAAGSDFLTRYSAEVAARALTLAEQLRYAVTSKPGANGG